MKNFKSSFLIILLSLQPLFYLTLNSSASETVGSWPDNGGGIGYPYQKNGLYDSNYNQFWEFFLNKTEGYLRYKYRRVNGTWIEPLNSPVAGNETNCSILENYDFSVYFENTTGPYVYVGFVLYNTTVIYESLGYWELYFRRGTIGETDITWNDKSIAIENGAYYFSDFDNVDVVSDSSGYPVVSGCERPKMEPVSEFRTYSWRCQNVNGSGSWDGIFTADDSYGLDVEWFPATLPLLYRDIAFLLSHEFHDGFEGIRLYIWNHTHNDIIDKGFFADNIDVASEFDCIAKGNNIHMVYVNSSDYLLYTWWNRTSETWSANYTISSSANQTYPSLVRLDSEGLDLACYLAVNDTISYSQFDGVSWTMPTLRISEVGIIESRFSATYNSTASGINDIGISWTWQGTEELHFDMSCPVINVDISITNMNCENWVFQGEKFYDFQATYSHNVDVDNIDKVWIRFSDEVNILSFWYNNSLATNETDAWGYEHVLDDLSHLPSIFDYTSSTVETSGNNLTVTFKIMVNQYIIDAYDVDLWMRATDIDDNDTGWEEIETNYFHIYNVGGKAHIVTSGSAGRVENGDLFDIYADEDSWVLVNQSFRQLKFIDAIFALDLVGNASVDEGEDYGVNPRNLGYYYFGMDYAVNNTWTEGWSCRLEAVYTDFGWRIAPAPNTVDSYIVFQIYWYYRGVNVGSYSYILGWFEGKSTNPPGDNNPNNIERVHLRLWFNKINGSSAVGGWIAPVYYGPTPTGNWWWVGSWAPLKHLPDAMPEHATAINSLFFHDLEDKNGNLVHYNELTMQRFWAKIERNSDEIDYRYQIAFTQKFDKTISPDPSGVDTPEPLEPMLPDLPQYGLFSWLAAQLSWLGKSIVNALGPSIMEFWHIFVGFLDTLFTWGGWQNGFSQILATIANFIGWIPEALTLIFQFLVSTFVVITGMIVAIMNYFVSFITFLGGVWADLLWMWAQLYPYWGWFPEVLIQITPLIMFFFLLWILSPLLDKGNYHGTMERINDTFGVLAKIFNFLWRILDFSIDTISRLIETVPVAE